MELRFYQRDAIEACYAWLARNDGNPCICIPTGGGKTPVIAALCDDAVTKWGGRVVVVSHVKELLGQSAATIRRAFPSLWTGVYSAGLNARDTRAPVIVAGIQSVYQRAKELGPRDLVIIDECHLVPPSGYGRYREFLADMKAQNPGVRVIGLTATPYRLGTGSLCGPEELLTAVCYEISVKTLIEQGFLCQLKSKCGQVVNTDSLHVKAGEFIESEAQSLMMGIVCGACERIAKLTADRRSVLVFACGIRHAESVVANLRQHQGQRVELITGESLGFERDRHIADFKSGALKFLVNVNVLTTGFDAPNVDAICLLRPTLSPGLYYQMVGRGFRLCPGKADCLVLDFAGNIPRHGPVDAITSKAKRSTGGLAPVKLCPECFSYSAAAAKNCEDCGYEFFVERKGPSHEAAPGNAPVLSEPPTYETLDVQDVQFAVHHKKGCGPDDPRTMRVRYLVGWQTWQDEWVCPEHSGWARQKFERWWLRRSNDPIPDTAEEAVAAAESGALARTLRITVEKKTGEKFHRVSSYDLGPVPVGVAPLAGQEEFEFPVLENEIEVPF